MEKRVPKIKVTLESISQSIVNLTTKMATKDDLSSFTTKDDLKVFAAKDDLKGFATKDDLKGFATKDDLKGFATKDDLKGFATKEDLKVFATKDDLSKAISNLPTRDEMNTAIENAVDDLARTVAVGFAGVDKRFEGLEQKVNRNYTGLSNQLDYVLLHYTRRDEHQKLDIRVKRLEKVC